MLHVIFHRYGIPPDEIYNKDGRAKRFIYGSMALVLEEEAKEEKCRIKKG